MSDLVHEANDTRREEDRQTPVSARVCQRTGPFNLAAHLERRCLERLSWIPPVVTATQDCSDIPNRPAQVHGRVARLLAEVWRPPRTGCDVVPSGLDDEEEPGTALQSSGFAPRAIRCRPFGTRWKGGIRGGAPILGVCTQSYTISPLAGLVDGWRRKFSGFAPRAIRSRPSRGLWMAGGASSRGLHPELYDLAPRGASGWLTVQRSFI